MEGVKMRKMKKRNGVEMERRKVGGLAEVLKRIVRGLAREWRGCEGRGEKGEMMRRELFDSEWNGLIEL